MLRPHLRVMVIDDDQTILTLMRHVLTQHEFDVVPARTGPDALRLARSSPPDLVLLDLRLPGMGGDEIIAKLRADSATARTPVVILSGSALTPARITEIGANGAMTKPIDPSALIDLIRSLTRS